MTIIISNKIELKTKKAVKGTKKMYFIVKRCNYLGSYNVSPNVTGARTGIDTKKNKQMYRPKERF